MTVEMLNRFYAELHKRGGGVGGKPLAAMTVRQIHFILRGRRWDEDRDLWDAAVAAVVTGARRGELWGAVDKCAHMEPQIL
jgi:hypothetical protein